MDEIESPASPEPSPASPDPGSVIEAPINVATVPTEPVVIPVSDAPVFTHKSQTEAGEIKSPSKQKGSKKQQQQPHNAEPIQSFSKNLKEKMKNVQKLYESFTNVASLGDMHSIYRSRNIWVSHSIDDLVLPAVNLFYAVPSARPSVLYYTGLLIHECSHLTFSKRENNQLTSEYAGVRDAINRLLKVFGNFIETMNSKRAAIDVLTWCCSVASELSSHNAGRPSAKQAGTSPEALLAFFMSCEPISRLIKLLDFAMQFLLDRSPEQCMKVLLDASRYGSHFNWVWVHIAITFPGSTVNHLLATGSEQFRAYVDDINAKKKAQVPLNTITAIQNEHQTKFNSLAEVFNFLMRRRNLELQAVVSRMLIESINCDPVDGVYPNLSLSFFLKLVTGSMDILRLLLALNVNLVSPQNVIRGIRQVMTVDKNIIMPIMSYHEFMLKVVETVETNTHGVLFSTVVRVVYDERVFGVFSKDDKDSEEKKIIQAGARQIVEAMVSRLLRIAHAPGLSHCPSEHPSISCFAFGQNLQFIIDAVYNSVESASLVIRHLHAIAISYGELKAAEIVMRFLVSTNEDKHQFMYVLSTFITTTAKFFPNMMEIFYNEFFAIKTLVENTSEDSELMSLRLNLINNLRILLEWEAAADDTHPITFLRIYPEENIGRLLNILYSDALKISDNCLKEGKVLKALDIFRMVHRLLGTICAANAPKQKYQRRIGMEVSQLHKLLAQLSVLLKMCLSVVGRDYPQAVSIFDEMRADILRFLYNDHLHDDLKKFSILFVDFFVSFCMKDSVELFSEEIGRNTHFLEDANERRLSFYDIDNGVSVIENIKKIVLNESATSLAHSGSLTSRNGQLKRRKLIDGRAATEEVIKMENGQQRVFVLLDMLRSMCRAGSHDMKLGISKSIAIVLTEAVCRDSLLCDFRFDDWEVESEVVSRYIEANSIVESSILCDGLLRILSDTESFGFCIPILKAQLASILIEAETTPEGVGVSERVRERLHRWVMITHRGGILPLRFTYICDLEQYSTGYEVYLMILEIWKYMQRRELLFNKVDQHHKDLLEGNIAELQNETDISNGSFDVFRLVIQKNISHAAHLFPKVFPAEFESLSLNNFAT